MKKTTKLLKINTCRVSPLLVYFEYCKMGRAFKDTDEIQNIPEWCLLEDGAG